MREKAAEIVSNIDSRGFLTDEAINLGDGLTDLGELYQKGTIFYKEYRKDTIPDETELLADLARMMEIYREYAKKESVANRKTWLLSWNPNNWKWEDYEEAVSMTQSGLAYETIWSCANTHVKPGDRVFLTVLGSSGKNGIIASGNALSESFEADHWDPEKNEQGKKAKRINVSFDYILNYSTQKTLKQDVLNSLFPDQQWSPQGSGIEIKDVYIQQLEDEWEKIKQQSIHIA